MLTVYRTWLAGLAISGLVLTCGPGSADSGAKKHVPLQKTIGQVTPTGPVPSLFVLNSDGASLADGKLTLTGVSMNSIVFADRPVRAAGHLTTEQFIQQWDEGKDNFAIDPPNATVSVLGGEGGDVSDAVVVLTKPVLEGTTLTFEVTVLEGALVGAGPAAIFIDDRGGGGGGGGGRGAWSTDDGSGGILGGNFGDGGGIVIGGQGNYYHAPDLHGAWYSGQNDGGSDLDATDGTSNPFCGEYPKPPCN
jgi:hypothetical protein